MADNILEGTENADTSVRRTQVYQVTHDGEGNSLPFMNRSFISFSYGGKNIEDFNLIATTSGDRWQQNGYANFNDLTTSYDVLDGQFFWGSHYTTFELDFELSTDGMTQMELDEFLRWFQPGKYKELILAEHPNRARLARVRAVPALSMIPFEYKTEVMINGKSYPTSTTEYRGTISLQLISDDPFWHARVNAFSNSPLQQTRVKWIDEVTGDEVKDIYNNKDILKVILEDGIPAVPMIDLGTTSTPAPSMILGDSIFVNTQLLPSSEISQEVTGEHENQDYYHKNGNIWYLGAATFSGNDESQADKWGITAGARTTDMDEAGSNPIVSLAPNTNIYFYYAGTAPSPLIISFGLTPEFDSTTHFIKSPANKYAPKTIDGKEYEYNTITIESQEKQELQLTTPNLYNSYNQVINIFHTKSTDDVVHIRELIRSTVRHPKMRELALAAIGNGTTWNASSAETSLYNTFSNNNIAVITINSKTGEAKGVYSWGSGQSITTLPEENIQDMLRSNNLIIKERNFPDENGVIHHWADDQEHPEKKSYSHRFYHNFSNALQNVKIKYQNLYL